MAALRLGVLASGRGSDLQSILDARRDDLLMSEVVVVVSDVPGAKALDRARARKIPAVAIEPDRGLPLAERRRRHDELIVEELRRRKVDLVVLAGYMRIVTPTLLDAFPQRVLNIHPALLPSFRGAHGQQQAFDAGVRLTGCTTHLVDAEVDHGPIILQAAVSVLPDDTVESLSRRILDAEHRLLPRTIQLFEAGRIEVRGNRVTIAPGPSWTDRFPPLAHTLFGPGY